MAKTLGPFEIGEYIARGGMGEVWRAVHRGDGREVAIKVLGARDAFRRSLVEAFTREVHSAASLNHPSIVAVWDCGEVRPEEAFVSEGAFKEGSPWLAMEYATLGTLHGSGSVTSWAGLRRVLIEILDALAHAHARGLIHRDLKPANVLITERDEEVRLLLADFGIAHAVDSLDGVQRTQQVTAPSAGTPAYMAPEQIRGAWRDWGPWTDLYALGCIAWELTTGKVPFEGESAVDVAIKHVRDELPPFAPLFEVPPGFEAWLRRMLSRSWTARYQRAADAAWALLRMDPIEPTESSDFFEVAASNTSGRAALRSAYPSQSGATLATLARLPETQPMGIEPLAAALGHAVKTRQLGALPQTDLPIAPSDWRRISDDALQSHRTGIGLFGVRDVPLVGRETERDLLWQTLRQAIDRRQPRVVLVHGASGTGKSKLMSWLTTRAHELGAATILRAHHASIAGLGDGMPRMLAQHFACSELDRSRTFERISGSLRELDPTQPDRVAQQRAAELTQLIAPGQSGSADGVPYVEFGSPAERYAAVHRYLANLAQRRPLLLAADDGQFGFDILGFVEHVLSDAQPFPLLVVIAVRDADLEERPLERRRLETLAKHHAVTSITLSPIPPDHLRLVVEGLVGVEPSLAQQLVTASRGDILFSSQIIADWIQRGALVSGPRGFRFADDLDFEIPPDLLSICEARLSRVAANFALPGNALQVMQIAAALGEDVDLDEWKAATERAGVRIPDGLTQSLAMLGIARLDAAGWSFAHAVMREALETSARRLGHWESLNVACGEVVTRAAQNGSCVAERRARHFIEARRHADALQNLQLALENRIATSAYDETVALAELYLRVASELGRPVSDDAAVTVQGQLAEALRFLGRLDEAEDVARQMERLAVATHSPFARAEALRVLAGFEHGRGNSPEGVRRYTAAIAQYELASDRLGIARCAHGRGWLNLNLSRPGDALDDFTLSAEITRELHATRHLAWALQGLAEACVRVAELDRGEAAANEALAMFQQMGSRSGEGMTLTTIGSLFDRRDEPAEAHSFHVKAARKLSSFNSPLLAFPMMHMIRAGLAREDVPTIQAALDLLPPGRLEKMAATFRLACQIARVYIAAKGAPLAALERELGVMEGELAEEDGVLRPELVTVVPVVARAVNARDPQLAARFEALTERSMRALLRASRSVSALGSGSRTDGA